MMDPEKVIEKMVAFLLDHKPEDPVSTTSSHIL
jgi:hypothetical protein